MSQAQAEPQSVTSNPPPSDGSALPQAVDFDAPVIGPNGEVSAPPAIALTPRAAEMVKKAMDEESLDGHSLRVGVIGGGCAGLQYLLDFSKAASDIDYVYFMHGVQVFVDPFSATHLRGTIINYVDGIQGSGFKFENPNAQRSCGCGNSFQ